MRLKPEYILRELGDTYIVVVDRPGERTDMSNILTFNESAAWLWKQAAGRDWDVEFLTARLRDEYDIDPEYALSEVSRIVGQWCEYGLTEES